MTDEKGFWDAFSMEDARVVITLALLGLAGALWFTDKPAAATTVFTVFATLGAQYYYGKGE